MSTQSVLTVVGFAVGGPTGAVIGGAIGSYIDGAPETPDTFGARLDNLAAQSSAYGQAINRLRGTARIAGNVIWSDGLTETAHTTSTGGGGKGGGGGGSSHTDYSYSSSFAIGLCEGEIQGIRKIWADSTVIYDATENASIEGLYLNGSITDGIRVYTGSDTQAPDPYIQSKSPNTPAYRGLAYVVFENLPLAKFGNRIPNITCEVATLGLSSTSFHRWTTPVYSHASTDNNITFSKIENGVIYNYGYGVVDGEQVQRKRFRYTLSGEKIDTVFYPPETAHLDYLPINAISNADYPWSLYLGTGVEQAFLYHPLNQELKLWTLPGYLAGFSLKSFGKLSDPLSTGRLVGWYLNNGLLYIFRAYDTGRKVEVWDTSAPLDLTMIAEGNADNLYTPYDGFFNGANVNSGSNAINVTVDDDYIYVAHENDIIDYNGKIMRYKFDNDYNVLEEEYYGARATVIGNGFANNGFVGLINTSMALHGKQESLSLQPESLSDVVGDLLESSGLTAIDYDLSALTSDNVRGFVLDGAESIRSSIEKLRGVYSFDLIEEDWSLVAVKKGASVGEVIPADDMAAHRGGDGRPATIISNRKQDVELPIELGLTYINQASDYQTAKQIESRLVSSSVNKKNIAVPLVLTDDEAKKAVSRMYWNEWEGRTTYKFSISVKFIHLRPSDIISITSADGVVYVVKITDIEYIDGLLSVSASSYNEEAYISSAVGSSMPVSTAVIELAGLQEFEWFDCPPLSPSASWGFYASASNINGGFIPSALVKSLDGGLTYGSMVETFQKAAVMGYTTGKLPDGFANRIDYSVTVDVSVGINYTLSSENEAAVLNGANTCLIGRAGRWEILRFVNATLISAGNYTLSGLIRGLVGTEPNMSTHVQSDRFVLLSESNIHDIEQQSSNHNVEEQYAWVIDGESIDQAEYKVIACSNERLKPLKPINLHARYHLDGTAYVEWERQARHSTEITDSLATPIGEDSEDYSVYVYEGSTLVRTITTTPTANGTFWNPETRTAFYNVDDRVSDGVTGAFDFKIAQVSAQVGDGSLAVASLPAPETFAVAFDLTTVSGYTANWALKAVETDGTHLFVMCTDGTVSSTKKDFIKTFTVDGSGNLTEVYSATHSMTGASHSDYNAFQEMFYKKGKLYVFFNGGLMTWDVASDGELTISKISYTRTSGGLDTRPGAGITPTKQDVYVSRGSSLFRFSLSDEENHGDYVSEGINSNGQIRIIDRGIVVFDTADNKFSYSKFKTTFGDLDGTDGFFTTTNYGKYFPKHRKYRRLFVSNDYEYSSVQAVWEINQLTGRPENLTLLTNIEDWSNRRDARNSFSKHNVFVGGYEYSFLNGATDIMRTL
jgi:hypothetical protein